MPLLLALSTGTFYIIEFLLGVVLLRMAELVRAPYAPWLSDRLAINVAPANLRDRDPVH